MVVEMNKIQEEKEAEMRKNKNLPPVEFGDA
jgi:hypothetical protein